MPKISTRRARVEAERQRLREVARVLLEAEPAEAATMTVTLHVAGGDDQLPRIPVIGMEPGAIRGSLPHRSSVLYHRR